jgi:hypothetical protein
MSTVPYYWIPNPMLPLQSIICCIECLKGEKCKGTLKVVLMERNAVGFVKNILLK